MSATAILARINNQVLGLGSTGIAANIAAIKKGTVKFPAVFVVPMNRKGGANRYMTGTVAQKRELHYQVVMAVRNISGVQGGEAITDIEQLYELVDVALFGHYLTEAHDPIVLVGGAMNEINDGVCWWIDEYATTVDRRAV